MTNLKDSILQFWFEESPKEEWFAKDPKFDSEVRYRFLDAHESLKKRPVLEITKTKDIQEILAMILLFDQFPRNMFRGRPLSFATDKKALRLTRFILKSNAGKDLNPDQLKFLIMPLMHSESLDDQNLCIQLFTALNDEEGLEYAKKHQEIIKKFGRFPHRNLILGRKSKKVEKEFLKEANSSF